TALEGGGFVVTWISDGQDGSSYGVYAQVYDASGAPVGDEIQVNTHTSGYQLAPQIAAVEGGGFVVTWQSDGQDGSNYGVYAQRYEPGVGLLDLTIDTTAPEAPSVPNLQAGSDTGASNTDDITSDTTPTLIGSG